MMSGKIHGWRLVGSSVRGASHKRKGIPNEDAWGMWQSGDRRVSAGIVADGHGDAPSLRSHVGSRLAVESIRQVVSDDVDAWKQTDTEQGMKLATESVEKTLGRWRHLVARDLLTNPLGPHELDGLEKPELTRVVLDPVRAYGSTLLATIVAPHCTAHFALGDGDLLTVGDDGRCQPVFDDDERFVANETASLCMASARDEFRVRVRERGDGGEKLIVLCTDGVSNAFRNVAGLHQLAEDLVEEFSDREHGEIRRDLPRWLNDFSEQGSGDDATICVMVGAGPGLEDDEWANAPKHSGRRPTDKPTTTWEDEQTQPCPPPSTGQSGDGGALIRSRPSRQADREEPGFFTQVRDLVSKTLHLKSTKEG